MTNLTYKNVHNRFKLNGFNFDKEDLCRVAYSFIKEGEDFEKPVGNFLLDWFDEKILSKCILLEALEFRK